MNQTILLEHEPIDEAGKIRVRALLRIEGERPEGDGRVPLNLSVVLDRSGSMHGPPLEAAKKAARLLLGRIFPDDTCSVVAYDDSVSVVASSARRHDQKGLAVAIDGIDAGGTTNLSGGWLAGRVEVEKHRAPEKSNRLVLLTDGLANTGITKVDELAALFRQARDQGVVTTTIGFGPAFDERFLARLADAGGGNTYYIEEPDQAPAIFEAELEELLSLSAQNLTIAITLRDGTELAAVHHSYPRSEVDGTLELRMGDLYASEPKLLLLEMLIGGGGHPDRSVDLASLRLTADVVTRRKDGGGGLAVEHRTVALPITFSPGGGPVLHPEIRRELVFLNAAAAREAALRDEADGRWSEGARRLRESALEVREHADGDPRALEEAQDLTAMAERLEAEGLDARDRKYMAQRSWGTRRAKGTAWEAMSRSRPREEEDHPDGA